MDRKSSQNSIPVYPFRRHRNLSVHLNSIYGKLQHIKSRLDIVESVNIDGTAAY